MADRVAKGGRPMTTGEKVRWQVPERLVPWNSNHEAVVWLVMILLLIGIVNVFSSTFVMAENDYGSPYHFLVRHLASLTLAMGAFLVARALDYHKWRDWLGPVTIGIFALLLAVLVIGPEINGSKRWLIFGPLSLQPAEFAKICSIMMAAYYLSYQVDHNREINLLTKQYVAIGILAAIVEAEPDMGTACVILGIPLVMLWLAGLKSYKLQRLVLAAGAGIVALCFLQPYRMQRVMVILDPWLDAQGTGYQTVRSLTAIGSGGFWGMGLGRGLSKYAYLPEAHTDFAFAVFSQENGFLFVLLALFLYAALAYYAVMIARDAVDTYGQLLASGIMVLIVGQATVNLLMVSGFFPVVGVPLPFISYAGSSLLMSMFSVGILVNIGRRSHAARLKQAELKAIQAAKNEQTSTARRPRLQLVK